jgi:outer membrane protein OmpA-like peptidoglycan-associated protein
VAGGYNFTKLFGARLAINAFQSKGGFDMDGVSKTWKWNYVAPAVDATLNLSNLFCGYNPNRFFTVTAFAGIGANIAWNNDEAATVKNELAAIYGPNENLRNLWDGTKAYFLGRAGLMADFRINSNWSVGAEVQANVLSDKYNSKKAGNSDWYFNGLLGVKYVFGKSNKEVKKAAEQPSVRIQEKIVEKVVEKVVEKKVYIETTILELNRAIFFKEANNTEIPASEDAKIKEIVDFLNAHPEAIVSLVGYADKETGNTKINAGLAEKRAHAVADVLKNTYSIAPSRITIEHKGDAVQPLHSTANRVTIAIAKSKVVTEK